jgi:hypothetical protein
VFDSVNRLQAPGQYLSDFVEKWIADRYAKGLARVGTYLWLLLKPHLLQLFILRFTITKSLAATAIWYVSFGSSL